EGPVDEHEGEAVRRVVVAKNLPRHRLLIRCLPPHARLADASREIGETLLHDLGELRAQRLPALVIQDHLERDVLEVDQRRLKDVEAGIVGEVGSTTNLQRTAQYCVAVLPQERQGRIGIFGIRPTDICSVFYLPIAPTNPASKCKRLRRGWRVLHSDLGSKSRRSYCHSHPLHGCHHSSDITPSHCRHALTKVVLV
ncbi:Os12g0612850, partial [Oryza sativa Japonica Group]